MRDAETIKNVRQCETIAAYKKLRIIQCKLNAMIEDKERVFIMPLDIGKSLSNAIDQIEQALEKIKSDTTDLIILEIMNEIDGEVRY